MNKKVLTFYIGKKLFGIDITLVKEINRGVEYTRVPGSEPHIAGLFNMRGLVVTLFDLSKIIGIGSFDKCKYTTCIILKATRDDPDQRGFLIECSGDVLDIEEEAFEFPPANTGIVEGEFIEYVVKLKDEILIVIDPLKIFKPVK